MNFEQLQPKKLELFFLFLTPSQIGKGALMQTLFACGPADVNPQGLPPLSAPGWGPFTPTLTKVHPEVASVPLCLCRPPCPGIHAVPARSLLDRSGRLMQSVLTRLRGSPPGERLFSA